MQSQARSGYASLLRNRNFALLWSGQTVSWFGDSLYFVSLLWLVQDLTGSRAMMGLVAACRTIPSLFGLFAGVLVDRWDRRRMMLVSDLGRAGLVAMLPLLASAGLLRPWHVPAVAFGLATVGVFFYPARSAMVPTLVAREDLTYANSLMSLSQQMIQVAGYALGGLLIAGVGIMPLFSIDAVTFLVSAAAIGALRLAPRSKTAVGVGPSTARSDRSGLGAELRAGLRYIAGNRSLMIIAPLSILLNLLFSPIGVLMPSWVRDVLSAGPEAYGFLQTAIMVGMVIGSLLVGPLSKICRRSFLALTGLAVSGLALTGFAALRSVPAAVAALVVLGLAEAVVNVIFMTWLQTIVPRQLLGRVFGALETISQIATPAGQAAAGILGQLVALPLIFGLSGLVSTAIGLVYAAVPVLRRAIDLEPERHTDTVAE